jgi:hypothetical protein
MDFTHRFRRGKRFPRVPTSEELEEQVEQRMIACRIPHAFQARFLTLLCRCVLSARSVPLSTLQAQPKLLTNLAWRRAFSIALAFLKELGMETTVDCMNVESKNRKIPSDDGFLKGRSGIEFLEFLTWRGNRAKKVGFPDEVDAFAGDESAAPRWNVRNTRGGHSQRGKLMSDDRGESSEEEDRRRARADGRSQKSPARGKGRLLAGGLARADETGKKRPVAVESKKGFTGVGIGSTKRGWNESESSEEEESQPRAQQTTAARRAEQKKQPKSSGGWGQPFDESSGDGIRSQGTKSTRDDVRRQSRNKAESPIKRSRTPVDPTAREESLQSSRGSLSANRQGPAADTFSGVEDLSPPEQWADTGSGRGRGRGKLFSLSSGRGLPSEGQTPATVDSTMRLRSDADSSDRFSAANSKSAGASRGKESSQRSGEPPRPTVRDQKAQSWNGAGSSDQSSASDRATSSRETELRTTEEQLGSTENASSGGEFSPERPKRTSRLGTSDQFSGQENPSGQTAISMLSRGQSGHSPNVSPRSDSAGTRDVHRGGAPPAPKDEEEE